MIDGTIGDDTPISMLSEVSEGRMCG